MLYKYPQEKAVRHEVGDGILHLLFHTEFLCILGLVSFQFIYKNRERFTDVCVILARQPCWSLFHSTFRICYWTERNTLTFEEQGVRKALMELITSSALHWLPGSSVANSQSTTDQCSGPPRPHFVCKPHPLLSPLFLPVFLHWFSCVLFPVAIYMFLHAASNLFKKSQYLNKRMFKMGRFFCSSILCTSGKKCV